MSLLAYRADTLEEVESFSFTSEQWKQMKRESTGTYLMYSTGRPAVLKTSRYGTQFFSHKKGGKDDRPDQEKVSEEHIKAQVELVNSLRAAGYFAKVEYRGADKDGQKWIADVYFEAKERKVAIEIQLSRQHFDDYIRRTERYRNSGIRCLWLLSNENYLSLNKDFFYRMPPGKRNDYDYQRSYPDLAYLPLDLENEVGIKVCVFPSPITCVRITLHEFAIGLVEGKLFYSSKHKEWGWKQ